MYFQGEAFMYLLILQIYLFNIKDFLQQEGPISAISVFLIIVGMTTGVLGHE